MTKYKIEVDFNGLPSTEFLTELLSLLNKHEQTSLNTVKLERILLIRMEGGAD